MTEFELYALQRSDTLETEYRSPVFQNRIAFLAGLRNIVKPDRFGRI